MTFILHTTEADRERARAILSGFVSTNPPADSDQMVNWVANHIAAHRQNEANQEGPWTPNPKLPPLDPTAPRRKMVIEIEVAADFEKRLDNQWMVEREIHADRWSWHWADSYGPRVDLDPCV